MKRKKGKHGLGEAVSDEAASTAVVEAVELPDVEAEAAEPPLDRFDSMEKVGAMEDGEELPFDGIETYGASGESVDNVEMETTEVQEAQETQAYDPGPANPNGNNAVGGETPDPFELNEKMLLFRQEVMDGGPDAVFSIDPGDIVIDPTRNGRTEERKQTDPDVEDLALSIVAQGQLMPGEVHLDDADGKLYLTYGFGRIAAIQLINKERTADTRLPFKCFVKLGVDSTTARDRNFAENHQRKELTVLDRAKVVMDYKRENPEIEGKEIAWRTGLSTATVSNYLKISGPLFSETVKQYIREGKIPQRGAVELCKFKTAQEIEQAATQMVKEARKSPGGRVTTGDVKKVTRVAAGSTTQRTAKEVVEVLDFLMDRKRGKALAATTREICGIFADIVYGRLSQEKAFQKLSVYQ